MDYINDYRMHALHELNNPNSPTQTIGIHDGHITPTSAHLVPTNGSDNNSRKEMIASFDCDFQSQAGKEMRKRPDSPFVVKLDLPTEAQLYFEGEMVSCPDEIDKHKHIRKVIEEYLAIEVRTFEGRVVDSCPSDSGACKGRNSEGSGTVEASGDGLVVGFDNGVVTIKMRVVCVCKHNKTRSYSLCFKLTCGSGRWQANTKQIRIVNDSKMSKKSQKADSLTAEQCKNPAIPPFSCRPIPSIPSPPPTTSTFRSPFPSVPHIERSSSNLPQRDPFFKEVIPNTGSIEGGSKVVILGWNFLPTHTVYFNNREVIREYHSDTAMSCWTPDWAEAGQVEISINQGIDKAIFTYTEPLTQISRPSMAIDSTLVDNFRDDLRRYHSSLSFVPFGAPSVPHERGFKMSDVRGAHETEKSSFGCYSPPDHEDHQNTSDFFPWPVSFSAKSGPDSAPPPTTPSAPSSPTFAFDYISQPSDDTDSMHDTLAKSRDHLSDDDNQTFGSTPTTVTQPKLSNAFDRANDLRNKNPILNQCQICNATLNSNTEFNRHIDSHRIRSLRW